MGVYWLDVFILKYRKRNKSFVTTEIHWLWLNSTSSAESNPFESSCPWSKTVASISISMSVPVSVSVEISMNKLEW